MEALFFLAIVGSIIYLVYQNKQGKSENIYESENPVDTRNFTFEKAVEGCCVSVTQIKELDNEWDRVDDAMRQKQNAPGRWTNMLNFFFKKGAYKENLNFTESEKQTKARSYYRNMMIFNVAAPIIVTPIALILSALIIVLPLWLALIVGIGAIVFVIVKVFIPDKEIKKERKHYPWRFNVQPLGSQMYILQQDANDNLEKTHRFYYDLYLPCKRKADELMADTRNRDGEYYKLYQEVARCETEMYNCTPMQRIKKFQRKLLMKNVKIVAAVATIATVAVTAGFVSMLNNAGKDIGYSPKSTARYRDSDSGNLYDEDGNRVPW